MAATPEEVEVMSINEVAYARWRAEIATLGWMLFGLDSAIDIVRDFHTNGLWTVLVNAACIAMAVARFRVNNKASQRLRRSLHQARTNRPLFDRYR